MALPSLFQTPEDYLSRAITAVQAAGSALTDFVKGSTTRTFYEGVAAMLSHHSQTVEQLRSDSYLSTATGIALDAKGADQGVARVAAVQATGLVRIKRTTSAVAVTIPAGWGTLQTVPAPGQSSIAYVTTADAVLGIGVTQVDVAAVAVVGGTSGNIAQAAGVEKLLLPVNPVNGFDTDGSFVARGPFTNGVDVETDDAYRARIPIEVAGRVKGRRESFLAAALRVPGVTSANALGAGESRGAGTVAVDQIEVYFEGDVGLLTAVTAQCAAATQLGQFLTVATGTAVPLTAALTVYVPAGQDTVAIAAAVKSALRAVVDAVGVGGTVRYSAAIEAVHTIDAVVSVTIPLADFRRSSAGSGTAGDVVLTPVEYATLADGSITVTVLTLP